MNDCLHCELAKAAAEWHKSHNASENDIINMLGRFIVEALSRRPEFKNLDVKVIVMGLKFSNQDPDHRLH